MKFGRRQINKPTPASINFWVRVWTVTAGVLLTSMESIPFHISPTTESTTKWFLGLTVTLANGLAPLFGAEISRSSVPVDQITAVEDK